MLNNNKELLPFNVIMFFIYIKKRRKNSSIFIIPIAKGLRSLSIHVTKCFPVLEGIH